MGLLIDRIKRLIAANLHELIEEAKNPETELEEFVAEMERSCGEVKAEIVDATNSATHFEKQFLETQAQAERWAKKAAIAVSQKEDDLAREALVRKANTESLAAHVATEWKEQLALAESLRQTMEQLQQQWLEAAKERDLLMARHDRAGSAKRVGDVLEQHRTWGQESSSVRLNEEILKQQHRLEAYQDLHGASLEAEFERLTPKRDIEIELKMLKTRVLKDSQP